MRICFFILLTIQISSCTQFVCYSNSNYAEEQAQEFCNKANNNPKLCKSLQINLNVMCQVNEKDTNKCESTVDGRHFFLDKFADECQQKKDKESCVAKEYCDWVFEHLAR